jgi:hypothetical protein
MDADFLALTLRKIDEFGGDGEAGGLLEKGTDTAAEAAAGHVGTAEGILDDRIIGAADFERAFPRADVQAGFAVHDSFEDQFADEL